MKETNVFDEASLKAGSLSKNSHISKSTGKPKVNYGSEWSAERAVKKMREKRGKLFSYYKCLYCGGYHIGNL